jgi:hypothetical protein
VISMRVCKARFCFFLCWGLSHTDTLCKNVKWRLSSFTSGARPQMSLLALLQAQAGIWLEPKTSTTSSQERSQSARRVLGEGQVFQSWTWSNLSRTPDNFFHFCKSFGKSRYQALLKVNFLKFPFGQNKTKYQNYFHLCRLLR